MDVDSVGENLTENRTLPGDTRAAPPEGLQAAPPGRVWGATLILDRPIVRVLPVHNDGGVSRRHVFKTTNVDDTHKSTSVNHSVSEHV